MAHPRSASRHWAVSTETWLLLLPRLPTAYQCEVELRYTNPEDRCSAHYRLVPVPSPVLECPKRGHLLPVFEVVGRKPSFKRRLARRPLILQKGVHGDVPRHALKCPLPSHHAFEREPQSTSSAA